MIYRARVATKLFFACPLSVLLVLGCAAQVSGTGGGGGETGATGTATSTGSGGSSACAQDCTQVQVPQCYQSVCNEGQITTAAVGQCAVVPVDKATPCDDGLFCTTNDACDNGTCKGGAPNQCGMNPPPCTTLTCDEASKSCSTAAASEGSACTPTDLCQAAATCQGGQCIGVAKDCSASPYTECNTVACNPATGNCDTTPDLTKNGASCELSGDICNSAKQCAAGVCAGGIPKDCSILNQPCANGICDQNSGSCTTQPIPAGGTCSSATDACHLGVCNGGGQCQPMADSNGTVCSDHNSCTANETCTNGTCGGGSAVSPCSAYVSYGFETCPSGWTFAGEFQCGTPTVVGPASAHTGTGCIATVLNGNYQNGDTYATTNATSPDIDLTAATAPQLVFWMWSDSELTYDGGNVSISTNNGTSFTLISNVVPAYDLTVNSQLAWSGDHSALGWRPVIADLSAYAGMHVKLRFAFYSDVSNVAPGFYVDDVSVSEAIAIPLAINTTTLPDGHVNQAYTASASKVGGSNGSMWSIVPGGTNSGWLTINAATGVLGGTPAVANQGPVTVTLKVQEPTFPSNVDYRAIGFTVQP